MAAAAAPPSETATVFVSCVDEAAVMFTDTAMGGYDDPAGSASLRVQVGNVVPVQPVPLMAITTMPVGAVSVTVTMPAVGPAPTLETVTAQTLAALLSVKLPACGDLGGVEHAVHRPPVGVVLAPAARRGRAGCALELLCRCKGNAPPSLSCHRKRLGVAHLQEYGCHPRNKTGKLGKNLGTFAEFGRSRNLLRVRLGAWSDVWLIPNQPLAIGNQNCFGDAWDRSRPEASITVGKCNRDDIDQSATPLRRIARGSRGCGRARRSGTSQL